MMRKLILMVVVGLICGGVWARGPFVIAKRGEARVVVSLEGEAGPSVEYAGEELVKYLTEMTGGKFRLVKNAPRGEAAIRVGGPCKETKLESIEIYVKDERTMVVTGEGRRGVLYAVYRLLEHFGCGFWAPRNETVPKKGDLVVAANFRVVDAPVMEYRQPFGESAIYNPEWCVKIGVNGDMWAKPLVMMLTRYYLDMMATAWKVAKVPLLVGGALVPGKGNDRRIEGVRNLSFFTTAASNETWCVYQGVKSKKEPVVDKNMLTCLQRIEFCEDGMLELDMRPEVNIELLQPDVAAVISAKAGKKKAR